MAEQEEGWPLGLQPVNVRVGLFGRRDYSGGSASFNTLLSGSPTSSTDFSSDLDTESTGSFFHDKSTTLGRLMGVSSIADLPRRSLRGARRRRPQISGSGKSRCRPKSWCFTLCPTDNTDATRSPNNQADLAPSLGQFLAVERRAATEHRRSHSQLIYGPDELALSQPETNSLFVNGLVAPPRSSPLFGLDVERRENGGIVEGDGYGVPLLFACMCG